MRTISTILSFLSCFLCLAMQIAEAAQSNADAHSHGQGRMTLVFHEGQLQIALNSPAANMLGFEHRPTTEAQRLALEQLSHALHQPAQLVTTQPECQVTSVSVELPYERHTSDGKQTETSHKHHDSHKHQGHRDIQTLYEWRCSTSKLPKITFNYFNRYPGFEYINLEWIIHGTQGLSRLHKNNYSMEITP